MMAGVVLAGTVFKADEASNRFLRVGVSYYDLAAFKELNATAERCNEELGTNFTLRSSSSGDWQLITADSYLDEIFDKFTDCVDPETKYPLVFVVQANDANGATGYDSDTTFSYEGIVDLEEGLAPMRRCQHEGGIMKKLGMRHSPTTTKALWGGFELDLGCQTFSSSPNSKTVPSLKLGVSYLNPITFDMRVVAKT